MSRPRRTRHVTTRSPKARVGAQHADWLTLVEPHGQWLTLPVLRRAHPDGLPRLDPAVRLAVREHARDLDRTDPAAATTWLEYLLRDVLQWGSRLTAGPQVPDQLTHTVAEHRVTLRPEYALLDADGSARVLVERYPVGTRLDARLPGDRWAATPIDRTALLCRATGVPIGVATDTRHVVVVYAPTDAAGGYATFDTDLFAEGAEATVLDAFAAVLGASSFFTATTQRLDALLAESASAQAELTSTLGLQVRRAVELLVDAISRANLDAGGAPLTGITPHQVYEASATVMMRLVFLLYAEERHLLPLGEPLYDDNYAVTTLRDQLIEQSDLTGDEPLELRSTAWHRLLATFRAVYAGISHDQLRMPAYGGSLFDPDRYPFLEGRRPDQPWKASPDTHPIGIDDLTVREILTALQVIQTTDAGVTEARRLSFRTLDVEQIGRVYEGLLDHSARRADTVVLGLTGKAGLEEEVPLDALETAAATGRDTLITLLAGNDGLLGTTPRQVAKLLDADVDPEQHRRLLAACDNDRGLVARVTPFAHLLRDDLRGLPVVIRPGAVYVTETSHRRDTGTEYTPRELADEITRYTLEPLVYQPGPQDGADPADWVLKPSHEILQTTVCDPAVGSGAVLVSACRYLADRLVEAWTAEGNIPDDYTYDPSVARDEDELVVAARRAVADRCLYGVDRDPMAVEMAKLSLWLTTLSKERPFTFVDHALQSGDSLLGVTSLDQITAFHLDPTRGRELHADLYGDLTTAIKPLVDDAITLRRELEALPLITVRDASRKADLHRQAEARLAEARTIADLLVGAALTSGNDNRRFEQRLSAQRDTLLQALAADGPDREGRFAELDARAQTWLDHGKADAAPPRHPLHWPLAFPEVVNRTGFGALAGNPPYLGNTYWKTRIGPDFGDWAARLLDERSSGKVDLCVLFVRRAWDLLSASGSFGFLLALNAKSGESAKRGTGFVASHGTLYRARSSVPWPGGANVYVNLVWGSKDWSGPSWLDGRSCQRIDGALQPGTGRSTPAPRPIPGGIWAFGGSDNSKGLAFLLRPGDAWLDRLRTESSPFLFPYYSGQDITDHGLTETPRWCVDACGASLEEVADRSPVAYEFLMEVVHPTRDAQTLKPYKGLIDRWWQFWNDRAPLYARLRRGGGAVAITKVAKYFVAMPCPVHAVYTDKTRVVGETTPPQRAMMFSDLGDAWVWEFSSRMETRISVIVDALQSLPFPEEAAEDLPDEWPNSLLGLKGRYGTITGVLNAYHDPNCADDAVEDLRRLRGRLNEAAATDLDVDPALLRRAFHDTESGVRYTFSPEARRLILDTMVDANTRMCEQGRTSVPPRSRRKSVDQGMDPLFGEGEES